MRKTTYKVENIAVMDREIGPLKSLNQSNDRKNKTNTTFENVLCLRVNGTVFRLISRCFQHRYA